MSENTKIEWADHTFNPWIGCTKVGPGCDHCYAKADFDDRKHRVTWGAGQARSRTKTWGDPVRWNKQPHFQCLGCGRRGTQAELESTDERECDCYKHLIPVRQKVFCESLADVFDNEVDPAWRDDLFRLIAATQNLDWLLLTKRIGNVGNMLPVPFDFDRNYPNVWIGSTIVNQEEADRDIPKLLAVPAAKRFLSMEPLLGPVTIDQRLIAPIEGTSQHGQRFIDWVIVGGESGPHARPMHPDWARSLRDQCEQAGVPFLFKQWGEFAPTDRTMAEVALSPRKLVPISLRADGTLPAALVDRVGKKSAGRLLDGREWNGVPA